MTLKDYVVYRLTGKMAMDVSNAAATGLLNLRHSQWDDFSLELAGLSHKQLPELASPITSLPCLTSKTARAIGLPERTPVILGAGDGVLSNLGAGAIQPGQAVTMIGSSGACRTAVLHPGGGDPLCRTWSYPLVDGIWIWGGAENSGGLVLEWFLENFYQPDPHAASATDNLLEQVMVEAAAAPPGADGLVFLPYLFGERAPLWDESARGAFIGLSAKHQRRHLGRAVLEGTIFALFTVFTTLEDQVGPLNEVRASGGYVRSPAWLQLQADLFNREILVPDNYEGAAMGAAMLGHYALGGFPDLLSAARRIRQGFQPRPQAVGPYRRLSAIYEQAYTALRPVFTALRTLREGNEKCSDG